MADPLQPEEREALICRLLDVAKFYMRTSFELGGLLVLGAAQT